MPDYKPLGRAFWAELFNAHDLRNVRGYFAPEFVDHNARPGTPDDAHSTPTRHAPPHPPPGRSTY